MKLEHQVESPLDSERYDRIVREENWNPKETAIIVCDVWDYHHCLNAVRRLEEFGPRLNSVLIEARKQGVTIIHSPSDCMPAYEEHPARKRAMNTAPASRLPESIESWCSLIPAEERAVYPIDQSDGGEDDDPAEHAAWAAKLTSMGRNPNLPWKSQSKMITIDAQQDFITDKGDEVWNILESRKIKNVILTGVHTNMCVLGRPFGLRQMARNGKNVVLMKDMTDTMYNPQRWPYVSHHEGTRRVISHIERFVCPTVTSDQFLGGKPFHFSNDREINSTSETPKSHNGLPTDHWVTIKIPSDKTILHNSQGPAWCRCVVRIPEKWFEDSITLTTEGSPQVMKAWCNGHAMKLSLQNEKESVFTATANSLVPDDANLIVLQLHENGKLDRAPVLTSGLRTLQLSGRWQVRSGTDEAFANMPLPAKFGASTDIFFSPPDALWTARALTRIGEFTSGIEGPACDADGNIFAVNFQKQGTIGMVTPSGRGDIFVTLPEGSIGNGIRFNDEGDFFVADYMKHNILKVNTKTRAVDVFAHDDKMNQPNDIAMAPDGTLYASDPNWADGTGQLWRIDLDGTITLLNGNMGTTNGIEVSPDGTTLYVNESRQRNIWSFKIGKDRQLTNKKLLRKFDDFGFDGMRCDVDGNLYITRHGKGTVVKLTPAGQVLQEISVLGAHPTNICFGGQDGRTAYVTEVEYTRLVSFRVDRPGRNWKASE